MNIKDLLKVDSVILNEHSCDKEDSLNKLIERHFETGHLNNQDNYKKAIMAREELSSTGVGNMIAIPHAQDDSVNYPSLVAMVDKEGVEFDSLDQQPAKVFFMIAVPKDKGTQHLEILAQLCQILMDEHVVEQLLLASTAEEFIHVLTGNMQTLENNDQEENKTYDVLAVTACPTGIAHTYMAAKTLEETAKEMGISIKVETNGARGISNELSFEDILEAKCIIVAADKKIEMDRFDGKPVIQVPVAQGIHNAQELLMKANNQEAAIYNRDQHVQKDNNEKGIRIFYKHLMNGISNIIPLLMITGILSTLIYGVLSSGWLEGTTYQNMGIVILQMIEIMGSISLTVLAAFIADSVSDRQGFYVAFITGGISLYMGGGIIEIIIIGFIIGYLVRILQKIFSYLPEIINSLVPNFLLPIIGFLGGLILVVIFEKLNMNSMIYSHLSTYNQNLFIPIGILLAMMMSIDMGGPINKTAYTIGIISICLKQYTLMSAIMIGGMIPPIVIGATMICYPKRFSEQERKGKWQCLIKGLCFVSEEAIPYMIKDKKGIHIPCIIASVVAGGLAVYFQCGQNFPHGGIFALPFIQQPYFFLMSIIIATVIGMFLIIILKKAS